MVWTRYQRENIFPLRSFRNNSEDPSTRGPAAKWTPMKPFFVLHTSFIFDVFLILVIEKSEETKRGKEKCSCQSRKFLFDINYAENEAREGEWGRTKDGVEDESESLIKQFK